MSPNHKLTSVIQGRTIVGTSNADGKMTITFDDGSTMHIKTGDSSTGNASVSTPGNPTPNPQLQEQVSPDVKRNDVYRNFQWNENKFNSDVSRSNFGDQQTPLDAPNVASNSASSGGTVKAVLQGGTTMTLQFEDGSDMNIPLAEATSSVMLRDKNSVMEYAD